MAKLSVVGGVVILVLLKGLQTILANCADPNYCSYRGKCLILNGSAFCHCWSGYAGNHCERRLDFRTSFEDIMPLASGIFNPLNEVSTLTLRVFEFYLQTTTARERIIVLTVAYVMRVTVYVQMVNGADADTSITGFGGSRCEKKVPPYDAYLRSGCGEHPEFCAHRFANGRCEKECNDVHCFYDGFDCFTRTAVCREECAFLYGDGKCDVQCSASQCGFDGGDCITILEDAQEPIVMEVMTYPMELCVKLRLISAELAQYYDIRRMAVTLDNICSCEVENEFSRSRGVEN
ncbi:unnamed protein product [Enterobius vermicularis]|uniref:EGF-like domain-containing protein n=1 Tax=Enterobius vermicularis TaxID=51028 RepID=A0A0N4V1F1_ENTVE|nr:unnamed protein product [Enterobius vermicularis]